MKIFASNQLLPIKSLKKTAKVAAITLPLMAGAESCTPLLFPPPPPPYPHHHPHPHPHRIPRPCPYPYPYHFLGVMETTQPQDTIQKNDVFELNKNDMAYIEPKK